MGLEFRRGRDGEFLPHWYGRVEVDGKSKVVNLRVKVRGTRPPTLRDRGDELFEASREQAKDRFDEVRADAKEKGHAAHLTKRLIQFKTGRQVEYVKLSDLAERWRLLGRENQPTASWLAWCDTIFRRFAESVPCSHLHQVTPQQVTAYTETLRNGFTRRTAQGALSLLKSAFARLLPVGSPNPFEGGISRKGDKAAGDTIHRRPLTANELVTLFETAYPDPFIYPLTVCAACTGLRIGDVCKLQWRSVDLQSGVIAVRTSKTGKGVEIPIFKPLLEVLKIANVSKTDSLYVWPEAALMYDKNRYGIVYRGKSLFARAFAKPADKRLKASTDEEKRETLTNALQQIVEAVTAANFEVSKRDRILDTLARYSGKQSYRKIEAETGRRRSQISEDLKEAERVSKLSFRHGASEASERDLKTLIGDTRQGRSKGQGKLAASLLGWHSLRGTWATLALSAGIPVETVKLITGHGTANTVLKFYYNPQREHLREVLGDKLPEVLTGFKADALSNKTGKRSKAMDGTDRVAFVASQLKQLSAKERKKLAALLSNDKTIVLM